MKQARSGCPIANALDVFGDRWTMVVLRDMAMGKRRFGEFLESPERVTTSILADRLARLEHAGLIRKLEYQAHPPRYEYQFSACGAEALPILQAICVWANQWLPDTWTTPERFLRLVPRDLVDHPP
jgi:DNA-binding HxlR family transcriptional regulator